MAKKKTTGADTRSLAARLGEAMATPTHEPALDEIAKRLKELALLGSALVEGMDLMLERLQALTVAAGKKRR